MTDPVESTALEWARVAPGLMVVATPDRAWARTVMSGLDDPFAQPMDRPGSVATTRRLLDGALGAAARAVPGRAGPAPVTPIRWAFRLAGYHCTTHATPPLMAEASRRFAAQGRTALATWSATKAREEAGHDVLALRDLEALGYDAAAVVAAVIPPVSRALVEYFTTAVTGDGDPIGCVGYAYALERLALARDARSVAAIQVTMPPGVDATRCLRVHSAIGSDAAHVEETVGLVAGLAAPERARIAVACYETALYFYAPPGGEPPDDEALEAIFAPCRHTISSARLTHAG